MSKFIVNSNDKHCFLDIRDYLCTELSPIIYAERPIVFLCIGTDRSTGDSLGPLIGEKIRLFSQNNIYIYGNLENPVHAKNLSYTVEQISIQHKDPYIIAIDACLGNINSIDNIIIDNSPLQPGLALNKDLPSVGDMRILGVVNVAGALEFMVLQNTRLFSVMKLANSIAKGINHFILQIYIKRNNSLNGNLPEKTYYNSKNSATNLLL
ncbi:spore protease YyaC [Inconstantimicrobium mannanitabidum]|uniref:Spore protease YyaC n=1 Tax=Inconstantimicrobium mannanitabidum TaxID=1604901 RepID=A0ACB5RH88_9CLOT|nr:spore protease YyaC [Clostridium sp. TW13]GKX68450.1 spore protease YyaC [Clostridium sp. TW13]